MRNFRLAAAVLLAILALLAVWSPAAIVALRNAVFDDYQRLFPRVRASEPVVIVAIDEFSLAALGQWPWPRTRVAALIDGIAKYEPTAIGLDLLFPEPDRFSPAAMALELPVMPKEMAEKLRAFPTNDELFAQAIRSRNVVLGIAGQVAVDTRFRFPPTVPTVHLPATRTLPLQAFPGHLQSLVELDRAAAGHGLLNGDSPDGIVRRAPLMAQVHNVVALSLGMEMLRLASGGDVVVEDRGGDSLMVKLAELTIPAQSDGTVWMRYSHHDPDRFVSAADVMTGNVPREKLAGKLVLIGVTGLGLLDYKVTALRESVPGVEVHAQLIEQLFDSVDLQRPRLALWVEVILLLIVGTLVIIWAPKVKVNLALGLFAATVIALTGVGIASFIWLDMLVDVAIPILGGTAALGLVLAGTLAESDRQRRILRVNAAHMAGELDAAKRIQMGLLANPAELFASESRFHLAAVLEPARTVGGDFYDCFMLDQQRLFFVVADVSGKGLPAAVFMAAAKSHIKSSVLLHPSNLSRALSHAQAEIGRENPEELFVTLFAGILQVDTGHLHYINAGHDAPFAHPPQSTAVRLEQAGGPPLCVLEDYVYPGNTHQLVAGEWLAVMTDGVTEAINANGEFFGLARVTTMLEEPPELTSAPDVMARILDRVHTFAVGIDPADDLTLLVVRWNG